MQFKPQNAKPIAMDLSLCPFGIAFTTTNESISLSMIKAPIDKPLALAPDQITTPIIINIEAMRLRVSRPVICMAMRF